LLLETPEDAAIAGAIDAQTFVRDGARARWLDELSQLRAVDASIARARHALVSLGEVEALRELATAERTLRGALLLPGAAAFYAELQLQLGVAAAQLGQLGLAEAAFARAARVDPGRRLLAGEAAPEVVALAARAFELAERAPEGELRVLVNAPGARVFVDDRERGSAPLSVRARSGLHVLRIEAEGHLPYACLFEIGEGQRPEQRFSLAPDPRVAALGSTRAALGRAPAAELARSAQLLLAIAPELRGLALGERAADGRGLLIRCARDGCRAPRTWSGARALGDALAAPPERAALSDAGLQRARAWLRTRPRAYAADVAASGAESGPVWQRWYVWTGVSAAVIGGLVLAAVAARSDPERRLRVRVDPSALH
jgi:hypothetical protein